MAVDKSQVLADVRDIVGSFPVFSGENELGDGQLGLAIGQAQRTYSQNFPRIKVEDFTGDSGKYYILGAGNTLVDWVNDFSVVHWMDYDAANRITDDSQPVFLSEDDGDFSFYRDASNRYIKIERAPDSSTTVRVAYSILHTLEDAASNVTNTIPNHHRDAIVYLAVSKFAMIAALRSEKSLDPPAGVEFVSMRNKGSGFTTISERFFDLYLQEVGGDEGFVAAGIAQDMDMKYTTGEQFIFHSGQLR
jgi:hypothetical protein